MTRTLGESNRGNERCTMPEDILTLLEDLAILPFSRRLRPGEAVRMAMRNEKQAKLIRDLRSDDLRNAALWRLFPCPDRIRQEEREVIQGRCDA